MRIEVSAPGKLILLGEHAVVYQRHCLVSAISKRLKLNLEKTKKKDCQIEIGDKKGFGQAAVKNFGQIYGLDFGLRIKKTENLNLNYGLGSSAAVIVSILKGLSELKEIKLKKRALFDLAYQTVLDVQGVGSGFDVAAAIYGGTLYYQTGGREIEKIIDFNLPLVVGWSGIKADTPTLVRQVAEERKKHSEIIKRIFDEIEGLVRQGKKALLKKDWPKLGRLMNVNQKLLENLGVSTEKLQRMIDEARKAGALGAKLSGAGGGDCMIALVAPQDRTDVEKAIEKAGGQVVKLDFSAEGVRIESTSPVDDPNELFVVVDEQDKVLGYETRAQCHQNPSLIHRAAGVAVFNQEGKILLQKRSQNKDLYPGFYTLSASGHVEKGENYHQTALRELKEELGINIPIDFIKKFLVRFKEEAEMFALFRGETNGPFSPNREEIERVEFFPKRKVQNLVGQNKLLLTPCAQRSLQEMGILNK